MGNIPVSGHKNLPVSYYCMPGSTGASQPMAPANDHMIFNNPVRPDPRAVLNQGYFKNNINDNVKVDRPFGLNSNTDDPVSFGKPFQTPQQDSIVSSINDGSGVTQPVSDMRGGSATLRSYREITMERKTAEKTRRMGKSIEESINLRTRTNSNPADTPSAAINSVAPSSQGSGNRNSWSIANRETNDADGGSRLTFDSIIEMIKEGHFKNIVTVVGAAFSASAGIPDYRSPKSQLHNRISHKLYMRPEDLFHREYYELYPRRFTDLFNDLLPGKYKPTISHYFIKLLENKSMLLRHYTQNVDNLDRMAGISLNKLVEAHGSFRLAHCTMCRVRHYFSWWKEYIIRNETPRCKQCQWFVMPDVTFIGDQLPREFSVAMEADYRVADLLIVMGTPLTLRPFAYYYNLFKKCPRLVINRENINKEYLHLQLFGLTQRTREANFDPIKNTRDVLWIGECDDAVELMAEKLGWKEELNTLMQEGHKVLEGKFDVFDENLRS